MMYVPLLPNCCSGSLGKGLSSLSLLPLPLLRLNFFLLVLLPPLVEDEDVEEEPRLNATENTFILLREVELIG